MEGSGVRLVNINSVSISYGLSSPIEGSGCKNDHPSLPLDNTYAKRGMVNITGSEVGDDCFRMAFLFNMFSKEE